MNEQPSENFPLRKFRYSHFTEKDESLLESEFSEMDCYAEAGKCIEKVLAKKGTPKSVVFELKESKQTKLGKGTSTFTHFSNFTQTDIYPWKIIAKRLGIILI